MTTDVTHSASEPSTIRPSAGSTRDLADVVVPAAVTGSAGGGDRGPDLSIVIPTRHESGNIAELLRRLDTGLAGQSAEVVFVDDSDDATPARIAREEGRHAYVVRLLHRPPEHRAGGLGGAVLAGFRAARAPWVVVMDGDLQHPPEVAAELVAAGRSGEADLVVATRYVDDGNAGGLDGRLREAVSAVCTRLAKGVFPRRLRRVTDPMSGFFAVRRAVLALDELRPSGYKILLEIVGRTRVLETRDVAFAFQPRFSGESKASLSEGVTFLRQLLTLRFAAWRSAVRSPRAAVAARRARRSAGAADPQVTSPVPGAVRLGVGSRVVRSARLALPLLVAVVAFPNLIELARQAPTGHRALTGSLVCLVAALVSAAGRLRARPSEPNVHDRQVDVVLAVPVLAVAAWLSVGWPRRIGLYDGLSDHEVVAVVALLCGTYLLTLGTRATLRIGVPLLLALTAMPSLAAHRAVPVAVVIVAVLAVALRLRGHRRDAAAIRAAGDPVAGLRSRRPDRWPPVPLATGLTAVAAVALGLHTADLVRHTTPPHRSTVTAASAPRLLSPGRNKAGRAAGTTPANPGTPTTPVAPATPAPSPSALLGRVIRPRVLSSP